jgi:adenylate cyclase
MRLKNILFILFTFSSISTFAQNAKVDSLKSLLENTRNDTIRVDVLNSISNSIFSSSPDEAIEYGNKAKELAEKINDSTALAYAFKNIGLGYYIHSNYVEVSIYWEKSLEIFELIHDDIGSSNLLGNLGVMYANQGDDAKGIDYLLRSLRLAEQEDDKFRIASALGNIGYVYSSKPATWDQALPYYWQALAIGETLEDLDIIGTTASNIGDVYYHKQMFDSAIFYLKKSLTALSNTVDAALTLNLMGKVYASQGDFKLAEYFHQRAVEISTNFDAPLELSESLLGLANIYQKMGKNATAISTYKKAQIIAQKVGADYILKDVYEGLAKSYASVSNFENAFVYQKLFDVVKDSIYTVETDDKIKNFQFSYEIDKKEDEIEILEKTSEIEGLQIERQKGIIYAAVIMVVLLLVMAIGIFNRYKYVRKTKRVIEVEKDKSEALLLNILPKETARELEDNGFATPQHYDSVSVLFTDFKSFTKLAESMSSQDLVKELNMYFSAFDDIMERYGLEKIKTIGDAYMSAGGIPTANQTHPEDSIKAGLAIQDYMKESNSHRMDNGLAPWELRVGIHTGPVVAGVVGKKKFAYDIWGDTVNVASRMESNGEAGKVNISAATYSLVKDQYDVTHRGKIEAKNKGEIDMYFVENEILEENLQTS